MLREFALEFDEAIADALDLEIANVSSLSERVGVGYFGKPNNNPEYPSKFQA